MSTTLDRQQSIRLLNTLLAAAGGVVLTVVFIYAHSVGDLKISNSVFSFIITAFWVISFSFIALVRFGGNLHFSDPSLTLPQMLWASTCSLGAMSICTNLDGEFYLLTLLTMVFGIFRCTLKVYYSYCLYVITLSFLAVFIRSYMSENFKGFSGDLLRWFTFGFCVFALSYLCRSWILLRSRLHQKNEELKHALQARSYFLANMSHEIRTPMNGVLGMLDVTLRSELPPEQRRFITIARSSANGLLAIINDILDFSKIEAGKMQIDAVSFDIHRFLQNLLQTFEAKASEKTLGLQLNVLDNVPSCIEADPVRVRQVLNNLLANAFKFTEYGEVVLTVSVHNEGEHSALKFSVSDTGIGIDKEKLTTLFDSFTQADASITRVYGGTGLGLAICKQLAVLMDGELTAESKLGKGSVFTFSLPLVIGECPLQDGELGVASTLPERNAERFEAFKVLLVDDNEVNLMVAQELLDDLGVSVTTASDGAKAVTLIEQSVNENELYTLVLMDCQMPVLDGYQATKKIRQHKVSAIRSIPVVAMTANAMEGDRERCLAAGMNDYISKPIDLTHLHAVLESWLHAHSNGGDVSEIGDSAAAVVSDSEGSCVDHCPQEDSHHWDKEHLLKLVNNKPERMAKILASYIERIEPTSDIIKGALKSGDTELALAEIHGLKGASANLGGARLADFLANTEKLLKVGELDDYDAWAITFEQLVSTLVTEMESYLNTR